MDSAQLNALQKLRDLTSRQMRLLHNHIGFDPDASGALAELEAAQSKLQDRLDLWSAEFEAHIYPCPKLFQSTASLLASFL